MTSKNVKSRKQHLIDEWVIDIDLLDFYIRESSDWRRIDALERLRQVIIKWVKEAEENA